MCVRCVARRGRLFIIMREGGRRGARVRQLVHSHSAALAHTIAAFNTHPLPIYMLYIILIIVVLVIVAATCAKHAFLLD